MSRVDAKTIQILRSPPAVQGGDRGGRCEHWRELHLSDHPHATY